MNPITHFSQLARYNVWATARLLDAVASLGDEDYRCDLGLFFRSIHGTLNHLLVGEHHIWFPRFAEGRSPSLALNAELEPERQALDARLRAGSVRWEPLIATLDAARFDGTLDYITTKGVPVSLPFAATLAHVFNHGTHHRGQITAVLTRLRQPCPELDLVIMLQHNQAKP